MHTTISHEHDATLFDMALGTDESMVFGARDSIPHCVCRTINSEPHDLQRIARTRTNTLPSAHPSRGTIENRSRYGGVVRYFG